jgi:hypothetical protein
MKGAALLSFACACTLLMLDESAATAPEHGLSAGDPGGDASWMREEMILNLQEEVKRAQEEVKRAQEEAVKLQEALKGEQRELQKEQALGEARLEACRKDPRPAQVSADVRRMLAPEGPQGHQPPQRQKRELIGADQGRGADQKNGGEWRLLDTSGHAPPHSCFLPLELALLSSALHLLAPRSGGFAERPSAVITEHNHQQGRNACQEGGRTGK